MPRNQIQFEDDPEGEEGEVLNTGREVDLSDAAQEDKDEPQFDDISPRLTRKLKEESDEDADLDDEDNEELKGRAGKRANWRDKLLNIEEKLEEVVSQNEELKEQNDALNRRMTKAQAEATLITTKAEAEQKLVKIRADLAKAMEDGNTAETIRLNEEMADIKADVKAAEKLAAAAPAADAAEGATNTSGKQARLTRAWKAKHPKFEEDPTFKAFVQAIDKQVANAGFNPASDEYWKEIDKRVSKRYPEEYRSERGELPTRRQHPASGASERDQGQGGNERKSKTGFVRRGSKVVLSEKQLQNMRRFGMDPESEADQKDYIRNNIGSK